MIYPVVSIKRLGCCFCCCCQVGSGVTCLRLTANQIDSDDYFKNQVFGKQSCQIKSSEFPISCLFHSLMSGHNPINEI